MTKDSTSGADIFGIKDRRVPFEYEILDPATKRGMGFFVTLISINEPGPKAASALVTNKSQKLARKGQNFLAEDIRQNSIAIISACITGWRWGNDADGKPASAGGAQLEFNPVNVRKVLEVDEIRNQIDAELNDESNFFTK